MLLFWIFLTAHQRIKLHRRIIALVSRPPSIRRMQSLYPVGNSSDEQFPVANLSIVSDSVVAALTLANICLDVQIGICMFLHPSDILALRKVGRHWKFSLLRFRLLIIKTCKAIDCVKLFNVAQGNGWFVWLRFIENVLTTPFSFQVSPYPTRVTWRLKRLRWDRVGGLSFAACSRNSISLTQVQ